MALLLFQCIPQNLTGIPMTGIILDRESFAAVCHKE